LGNKSQQFQAENQQYPLPFLLSSAKNKKVQASYTGKDISTDGGALLLKEMDNRLGLINKLRSCIIDESDQGMNHQYLTGVRLYRVTIFQIKNYFITILREVSPVCRFR
jgi:hypothetical protein